MIFLRTSSCESWMVMLASGLKGIEEHLEPPEPVEDNLQAANHIPRLILPEPFEGNIFKLSQEERTKLGIKSLPSNLGEAIHHLEESEFMWETLGSTLMNHIIRVKKNEYDEYRTQVTRWELEKLLPIL